MATSIDVRKIMTAGGLEIHLVGEPVTHLEIYLKREGRPELFARSQGLVCLNDDHALSLPAGELSSCAEHTARIDGCADGFHFRLELELPRDYPVLNGMVSITADRDIVGWGHFALRLPAGGRQWIYPWINAGRYCTPRCITDDIGVDDYRHIWAALAGVPVIIAKNDDVVGSLGFPLRHCYRFDGLAFDPGVEPLLALGAGWPSGTQATGGAILHRAGETWSFPWQLVALPGGFPELARAWAGANGHRFETEPPCSPSSALRVVEEGRSRQVCRGLRRYYPSGSQAEKEVCGYRHGSDDERIGLYRQSWNAYADYLLFQETGKIFWRKRAMEQIRFLLTAQTPQGWFREDWNLAKGDFTYQGITEFGPRPDHNGMVCDYLVKLARAVETAEGLAHPEWYAAARCCLHWIIAQQLPDGGFPMTVFPAQPPARDGRESVPGGFLSTEHLNLNGCHAPKSLEAPMGRLLVALAHLAPHFPDLPLDQARERHERWILDNCAASQQWWGSHKDTGLMIDYGGLQSFVQYCLDMYERGSERRYLELAREATYFNFFAHCPKDLEWLRHSSKWGIMEQGNYMQYDIDLMDNLIYSSWFRLAALTGDDFLAGLARQALRTAMFTLCTGKRSAWYGSWGQYLVDPLGTAVTMDTSPVDGDATKYTGSIVCSMVEELLLLRKLMDSDRRVRSGQPIASSTAKSSS